MGSLGALSVAGVFSRAAQETRQDGRDHRTESEGSDEHSAGVDGGAREIRARTQAGQRHETQVSSQPIRDVLEYPRYIRSVL